MMKIKRIALFLSILLPISVFSSGCAVPGALSDFVNKVIGAEVPVNSVSTTSLDGILFDEKEIDTSIAAPTFDQDLGADYNVAIGSPATLEVSASAPEGQIRYQWYHTTTKVDGGGTKIEGATEASYSPESSEAGTSYYYVVAYAEVNQKVNLTVSQISGVTVWNEGNWQKDEAAGGYRYVIPGDGSYPVDLSMDIQGTAYRFDTEGFAVNENGEKITPADAPQQETEAAEPPVENTEENAEENAGETPEGAGEEQAAPPEGEPAPEE